MIYKKVFKSCAQENLRLWECPNFIFSILGLMTIGVMIAAFFISRIYLEIEIVAMIVFAAAVILLVLNFMISSSVHKLAQAKHLAEKERAKTVSIIQNLSDGLVMLDSNCRVSIVNPMAESLLGVKQSQVKGLDIKKSAPRENLKTFFKVVHWCPPVGKRISNQVMSEKFEIRYPRHRSLKVKTSTIKDEKGRVISFIKSVQDVTREEELDELKSDFISIASHQLKTPLSSMKWNLEIMDKEINQEDGLQHIDLLENTIEANEEMISIVRDLLDVSRIEQGKTEPKYKKASLERLIRQTIDKFKFYTEKKNISLQGHFPGKDIEFMFDVNGIAIVLTNLLDNAKKYTEGEGKIDVFLEFLPEDNPVQARVTVRDTGVGIAPEEKKNLFSKFHRGKDAFRHNTRGSGLGLYIANNIVSKHQGAFEVKSQVGKGSSFSFTIPLKFSKNES